MRQDNYSTVQRSNGSTVKRTNGQTGPANPTAESIVARLPDRPLVNARDIADALSMVGISAVTAAIEEGAIHAVRIGGQYRIAREEAARWIRSLGA